MLHTFFFSPSDTTRKYAVAMTEAFGDDSQLIDLTHGPCQIDSELIDGDTRTSTFTCICRAYSCYGGKYLPPD